MAQIKRTTMSYIGIDPGVKTGLAHVELFDNDLTNLEVETTFRMEDITRFVKTYQEYLPTVIVERAPDFGDPQQLLRVENVCDVIKSLGLPLVIVGPGEWKPLAKAMNWPNLYRGIAKTIHEKDALCLIRYYLWKFLDYI